MIPAQFALTGEADGDLVPVRSVVEMARFVSEGQMSSVLLFGQAILAVCRGFAARHCVRREDKGIAIVGSTLSADVFIVCGRE